MGEAVIILHGLIPGTCCCVVPSFERHEGRVHPLSKANLVVDTTSTEFAPVRRKMDSCGEHVSVPLPVFTLLT